MDELRARVRALIRRSAPASAAVTWRDVVLDGDQRRLNAPGGVTELTRLETIVAELLFRDPSRIRTREELTEAAWPDGPAPTSNTLDVTVSSLRRKITSATGTPAIRAVRGLGYRLEP